MPDPNPIRILVTGFGAFPGVRSNPSELLLQRIDARRDRLPANIQLETALLPTTWEAVERFTSGRLASFDPDIALHFGVHKKCSGFRIETTALNSACPHADAQGKRHGSRPLVHGAPNALRATLDAGRLAAGLRARRYCAATSPNAGRYLCNMLFYLSLRQNADKAPARQTGFVHIPQIQRAQTLARKERFPVFSKGTLFAGAEMILNHCISAHRRARS